MITTKNQGKRAKSVSSSSGVKDETTGITDMDEVA